MSADTADDANIPQPTPPSYGLAAATPSALGGHLGAPLGTASPHRDAAASPVAAMAAVTAKAVTATATETRQEGRAREQMRLQEEERQITRRLLEEVQLRQGAERDRADLLRQREAVLVETAKLEQAEIDRQFRLAQETTNEGWAREFRTRSATERRVAFLKKDRELHETEADARAQVEREARHDRKAIRDMEQKEWYEATRTSAYYDLHRELDTEDRDRRMQVDQLCSLEKEKQMEYSLEWARHRKMWAEQEGGLPATAAAAAAAAPAAAAAAAATAAADEAAAQAQRDGLMQRESERLLAESRIKELERASKSFGQAIYQQGYFIGEAPALAQQQQQQHQQQQADGRFSSTIGSESASYFGLVSPTRDAASKRTTAAASGTSPAQTFSASLSVPSVRALTTPNNDPDACFSPLNAFRGFASGAAGGETGSPLRHPPSVTATELAGVSQRTQLEDQLLSQSIARQAQLLHTISSSSGHPVVLEQTEHPTKSTLRGEEETHCYRRATSTTVARESPRRQHSVTARQTATVVAAQTAAAQAAAAAQQAAAAAAAAAAPSATLPSHAASYSAHVAAAPHLAPAGAVYDSAGNQIRSPAAAAAAAADAAASAAAAAAAAAAAQQQQQQASQAGESSETMTGYVQGLVNQALGRGQAGEGERAAGAAPAGGGVPPPLLPSVPAHPGGPLGPAVPLRGPAELAAAATGAHLSPAVLTPVEAAAAAAAAAASLPLPVVTPPELIAEVVGEIKKLAEERDSEKLKVEDLSRELAHSQAEMERVLADIRETHETQVAQQGQDLQQKVEVMNALKSDRERANEETAYLREQLEKTVVEASTLRDELLARSSVATSAGLDRHASLQSPARQHAPQQPTSFQPPRIQSSALNELLKPAAWGFAPSSVPPQPQQAPQPQAQAPASPQQQRSGEEAGEMEALRAQLEATKRELEDHKQRTRGVDATAQMAHAQLQMQRHMTGDSFAASPGGFYDHPSTSTQDTLEGSAAHKPPLVSSVMQSAGLMAVGGDAGGDATRDAPHAAQHTLRSRSKKSTKGFAFGSSTPRFGSSSSRKASDLLGRGADDSMQSVGSEKAGHSARLGRSAARQQPSLYQQTAAGTAPSAAHAHSLGGLPAGFANPTMLSEELAAARRRTDEVLKMTDPERLASSR